MIETIYIEDQVANHPRTLDILARFPNTRKIHCQRSEMLNFCSKEILKYIPEEEYYPCQEVLRQDAC